LKGFTALVLNNGTWFRKEVKGTYTGYQRDMPVDAEVRLYTDYLNHEDPSGQKDEDTGSF